MRLTHVYAHLATDALVVVFAPAFPFVAQRQEKLPQIANAHSLGRYGQVQKNKNREKKTNNYVTYLQL